MPLLDIFYLQDHILWISALLSAALAVGAGIADRKRQKRARIEAVGFMPWTTITVLAGIACFISVLYAIALQRG